MNYIFQIFIKQENKILYISILITFLLISFYNLSSGFVMSSDSYRFTRWADSLIKLNFNFYEFFLLEKTPNRPSLFFFSVPVFLIALCKVLFGNGWQLYFLFLNLSLLLFSLIFFVKSLSLIGVRPIVISMSFPIILVSIDLLTYPKFILSDMIFAFVVVLATFLIVRIITKNKINYLNIFIIIFFLLASRPSAIPVVFAISLFLLIFKFQIFSKLRNILIFFTIILISIPFMFACIFLFLEFFYIDNEKVKYLIGMVKQGMIVHDRPNTWISAPNNFLEIVKLYFFRLAYFFSPYVSTFSKTHIVLNMIQVSAVLFSIFIWIFYGKNKTQLNLFFLFVILLSISVAAFHSFILLDYDWRYRFPIILPLLMLFPISLELIFKKIYKYNN